MPVTTMNHFTILTDDVAATVDFYRDLLGLVDGPRPPFDFPGAWLYAGERPILHVVGGRNADELRPGVIDHMAFSAEDLSDTLALLASRNIAHTCRRLPGRTGPGCRRTAPGPGRSTRSGGPSRARPSS